MCCASAGRRLLFPEGRQDGSLNFVLPTGLRISSNLYQRAFVRKWPAIAAALQLRVGSILALSRFCSDAAASGGSNPCEDLSIRKLDPQQGAAALAAVIAASCPCHGRGLCDTSGWPLGALPPGIVAAAVGAVRVSLEERPATRPSYITSSKRRAAAAKALQPQAAGGSSSAATCAAAQPTAAAAATQACPQSDAAGSDMDSAEAAEGGSTSGDSAELGAAAASFSCDGVAEQCCSIADGSSPAAEAAATADGAGAAAAQSVSGASEVDSGATAPFADKAAAAAAPDTAAMRAAPGSPQLGAISSRDVHLPADTPAQRRSTAETAVDLTVSVSDDIVMLLSSSDDESDGAGGGSAPAAAAPVDDSSSEGKGASAAQTISRQPDTGVAAGGSGGKATRATAAGSPGRHSIPPLLVPPASPSEQQHSSPRLAAELSVPDTAPVASDQPAEECSVPDTAPVASAQPAEALSVPDTAPVASVPSSEDEDTASSGAAPKSGLVAAEGLGGAAPQAASDSAPAMAAAAGLGSSGLQPSLPAVQPHKAHGNCQGVHKTSSDGSPGSVLPRSQHTAAADPEAQQRQLQQEQQRRRRHRQQQQAGHLAQGPVTVVIPQRRQPHLMLPNRLNRWIFFSSPFCYSITADLFRMGQAIESAICATCCGCLRA
jgi:hypothetical protein